MFQMQYLSIGTVADLTGVKVPTIRYYESAGMLPKPRRTAANRRLYDEDALKRIAFIRHARGLGFAMSEIKALLALQLDPAQSCREADVIARARLAEVEQRIRHLQSLRKELKILIGNGCRQRVSRCKVIEGLLAAAA